MVNASPWIMGDIDEGDACLALNRLEFGRICWRSFRSSAESGSSSSKTEGSTARARAHSHALALPAGKLRRLLVRLPFEGDELKQFLSPFATLRLCDAARLKPESDVFPDAHQRKKRKALENEGGRPLVRAKIGDIPPADPDAPGGRLGGTGNHAQNRCLPAADGPRIEKNSPALWSGCLPGPP